MRVTDSAFIVSTRTENRRRVPERFGGGVVASGPVFGPAAHQQFVNCRAHKMAQVAQ